MQKIYVVEDDASIRELVLYALNSAGFEVEGFSDGSELFLALSKSHVDLILLDIMLPDMDGISILKEIRQHKLYKTIPVIMLTAKNSELDRVKGLDFGSDDYIAKPFSVLEVISRVRAVLRRSGSETKSTLAMTINSVTLYPYERTVYVGSNEISLTYKEFELLQYLMVNKGIVLSRDKILETIWGYNYDGESRTVDVHIKSLRQKMGSASNIIRTVRNVGYKVGDTL